VAFELDGPYIWVGVVGPDVARTRKLLNIGAGRTKVSLVVDDLLSMDPFPPAGAAGLRRGAAADRAGGHDGARAVQPHHCDGVVELETWR
jgi:pyridoxamine 5'-phosphate oxidase family protein